MPSSIIQDAAERSGLDADYLDRIMRIESGGNPNACTGSYCGLFQLSRPEFARYGGRNIFDPADNARTAAAMMADQRREFTQKYGRPPTPTEAYMIHQQGAAGLDAHLANPDAPAWQNMASTGEGRQKGAGWARQAIWGNIPDEMKRRFGTVDNVTSDAFVNQVWKPKVEGDTSPASGSPTGLPVQAEAYLEPASGSPPGLPAQAEDYRKPSLAYGALGAASDNPADRAALGAKPVDTAAMRQMLAEGLMAKTREKEEAGWDETLNRLKIKPQAGRWGTAI